MDYHEPSALNTMQGLVAIDKIMSHKRRELRHASSGHGQTNLARVPNGTRGFGYFIRSIKDKESSFNLIKRWSEAHPDIPNSNFANEITVRMHSQLKLLLFLSLGAPSLSRLGGRRTRGFYNALRRTTPTGLSLLSRLSERVRAFTLL